MSEWTDANAPAVLSSTEGVPDNHVITIRERRITVDFKTLIQNNVKTDTVTLDLDAEWDGVTPVIMFGDQYNATSVIYTGEPVFVPANVMLNTGGVDLSVTGYDSSGEMRLVTVKAVSVFEVIASGAYDGEAEEASDPTLLGQVLEAATAAQQATAEMTPLISEGKQVIADAKTAATDANEAAVRVDQAAADAEQSLATITQTEARANAAANAVESALASVNHNVLKRTIGPAEVLTAEDTYAQVPLGLKVYGNTRQNLWVNPSGTKYGMTVIINDDGSISIDGTVSGGQATVSLTSYNVKPSTTYCFSCDEVAENSLGFLVRELNSSGSQIASHWIGGSNGNTKSVTFTTSPSCSSLYMLFGAPDGATVSGTFRVMLNEGETAEPWCPPGLNSVSEVSAVLAGKNICTKDSFYSHAGYANLIVYNVLCLSLVGKKVTISFDIETENGGYWLLYAYQGSGLSIDFSSTGKPTIGISIATEPGVKKHIVATGTVFYDPTEGYSAGEIWLYKNASEKGYVYATNVQIELGSTATEYEPPNVNTVPIDLQGNELRGAKDGTKDYVEVSDGSLIKNVYEYTINGSESFWTNNEEIGTYGLTLPYKYPAGNEQNILCDTIPVRPIGEDSRIGIRFAGSSSASLIVNVGKNSVDEVKAWFTNNPTKIIYVLETPQTIQLTPPELPELPAPNLTAYTDSDIPAETELTYARDVNMVVGKLESAIETLLGGA